MASDGNFSMIQRTLPLQFTLTDGREHFPVFFQCLGASRFFEKLWAAWDAKSK